MDCPASNMFQRIFIFIVRFVSGGVLKRPNIIIIITENAAAAEAVEAEASVDLNFISFSAGTLAQTVH